jgi:predicted GNAT family N-acyltransferase
MAIKIIDHNSNEYQKMVQLRLQILRQPLGLSFTSNDLEAEKEDILIAAFEEDEILGCCLLTNSPNNAGALKLRQMAVKGNLQGNGVGRQILHFAENIARDLGNDKLMMHARHNAIGFYEKQGYKTIGEMFEEVSIPHFVMEKKLR